LGALLRERFADHPNVGDIRGRGLLWTLELVADRGSKAPFDPKRRVHFRLKRQALENGLLCYPMGGTIDGRRGDHVLIAPPYIVEASHLHELVDKLAASIAQGRAP
jgi:adenosylmethionine-8-amino-7-oxononanoate aminotransferase